VVADYTILIKLALVLPSEFLPANLINQILHFDTTWQVVSVDFQ